MNEEIRLLCLVRFYATDEVELSVFTWSILFWSAFFRFFIFVKVKQRFSEFIHKIHHLSLKFAPNCFLSGTFILLLFFFGLTIIWLLNYSLEYFRDYWISFGDYYCFKWCWNFIDISLNECLECINYFFSWVSDFELPILFFFNEVRGVLLLGFESFHESIPFRTRLLCAAIVHDRK